MRKVKTAEEIQKEVELKAAKAGRTPADSAVIKTIAEAVKIPVSETSVSSTKIINGDTIQWEFAKRLTEKFEGFEFTKKDGAGVMQIFSDVIQEISTHAYNMKKDFAFNLNGKTLRFKFVPETTAPDAVLLQDIAKAKANARAKGVEEENLDAEPEVIAALESYRTSSVERPAHVKVEYGLKLVEKDGELVRK